MCMSDVTYMVIRVVGCVSCVAYMHLSCRIYAHELCRIYGWVVSCMFTRGVTYMSRHRNTQEHNATHCNAVRHTLQQFLWFQNVSESYCIYPPVGVTHVNESRHTCEWVTSHMWMSHVTHVNESCHTCEWVMSRMWMSRVTHVNESCHKCEWVMSHTWLSHVTHVNESCHTFEWVMSRMWMSHVAHVNKPCHRCEWVISHIRSRYGVATMSRKLKNICLFAE